jgi:hypothetical protein
MEADPDAMLVEGSILVACHGTALIAKEVVDVGLVQMLFVVKNRIEGQQSRYGHDQWRNGYARRCSTAERDI